MVDFAAHFTIHAITIKYISLSLKVESQKASEFFFYFVFFLFLSTLLNHCSMAIKMDGIKKHSQALEYLEGKKSDLLKGASLVS